MTSSPSRQSLSRSSDSLPSARYTRAFLVAVAALALIAGPLGAQTQRVDSGGFRITPLIAPAYNPEMQFLIAGGVLMSWKPRTRDTTLQRSTLVSTISYSTTGAVNVSNNLTAFFAGDRLRVLANLAFKNMPDNYWGVGYDAGLSPYTGDSTTYYRREWWQVNPRVVWEVKENLFVGGSLDFSHSLAMDPGPRMTADSTFQANGPQITNAGVGIIVQYDSRDVTGNAWRGRLLSFAATAYGRVLGGTNAFETFVLDYREYKPLGRDGRTLAWQVKTRVGVADVPWSELSMLGTGYDIRGYVEGRFRDRSMIFGLAEYRHMFTRSEGRLSRHGIVAWAGGGFLGPAVRDLEGFLPNAGVGYRLELQPRANVRVDVGIGRESHGIYFSFNEAF